MIQSTRKRRVAVGPAIAVGVTLFVTAAAVVDRGLIDSEASPDVRLYVGLAERMRSGEVPYRDFFVEYPPGALPAIAVPAVGPEPKRVLTFKVAMAASGAAAVVAVAVALAAVGAGTRRLWAGTLAVGLSPLALGPILFNAYDLWPTALAVMGLALMVQARHVLGAGILGLATAAKVFAIVMMPVVLLWLSRKGESGKALAAFLGVGLAVTLPFAVLAPGGLAHSLQVQAERGLQIESLGASLLLALEAISSYEAERVTGSPGSHDLAGTEADALALASTALQVLAIGLVVVLAFRRRIDGETLFTASAAAIAGFVAVGKVLSPQYLIWLVPLVALVGGAAGVAGGALLLGTVLVTHLWFVDVVTPFDGGADVALVLARNLGLVALFGVLAARLARVPGQSAGPPARAGA